MGAKGEVLVWVVATCESGVASLAGGVGEARERGG